MNLPTFTFYAISFIAMVTKAFPRSFVVAARCIFMAVINRTYALVYICKVKLTPMFRVS